MRKSITLLLISVSIVLAVLPLTGNRSFRGDPHILLEEVLSDSTAVSADQVARWIVLEDNKVRLIDLRSVDEYRMATIPGSVNVPFQEFIGSDPDIYFNDKTMKTVLFCGEDLESGYALVFARGLGYRNVYELKGGISEWINTVMETEFSGDRISARENAIFEMRTRAGRLYTELVSMPDSLKASFLESKKFAARKLDGGCE